MGRAGADDRVDAFRLVFLHCRVPFWSLVREARDLLFLILLDVKLLERDKDLDSLRSDPRFVELVEEVARRLDD